MKYSRLTKEQFEEIRNKSKAAIIEAALELFANNGFHSTSVTQIAKKAGVSKGLMYNYFDSKEALLEAIIFQAADESQAVLDTETTALNDFTVSMVETIVC